MFAWLSRRKSAAEIERALTGAMAHHDAGRLDEAEAAYREVLDAEPRHVDALHFLGFLALQRGQPARAADLIARSLEVQPANARAQLNLGNARQSLGEPQAAAASFEKALALQPDLVEARYNLGVAWHALGHRADAAACFREAIRLQPALAQPHHSLGQLLWEEDRVAEAQACFREALRLNPDHAGARWAAALAREDVAAGLDELEPAFAGPRAAAAADAVGSVQPFSLAYRETPNRPLLERHGRLCARVMGEWQRAQGLAPVVRQARDGALRVGIVSAQFHNHSVWHAIVKGWFQQIDRGRFALHAFHIGAGEDEETRFAASRAAHFERGPKNLRAWVDAILRQRPDVLIYPEVGMHPLALQLASLRLAPVQAASWGHPETSGLPTIDYYLSAEDLEPPGAQANYAEKLVALPRLGCYFEPRAAAGERPPLAALGLDAGRPLLVCPGVPYKYAPQHDGVFPAIAERLGACTFVFFRHATSSVSAQLEERLKAAFAARSLDAARFVRFIPWLPNTAFQGLMAQAHVFLDTIGFSGFNTALQAVQSDLPVVTREGRFMRGRLASGILKRMGMAELVVATEADYVALAEKIARDHAYRSQVVSRMAARRDALFRDLAPIRALEQFLADA